ncbi:putative amino acid permease YtnA [Kurthia zopfii]|uniref:Amino acid/polyamine/organocation transporter (APC superfamily) n=1 Tax=Kurthia zopfii TaxID=1650 RepID=A0A8B4QD42_9BACL|nr:amino acid permease [Kurthia zopfii]PWI23784.1 amino acid permease [Kurthia zopfii]TDR43359.1 amino acid/polyamine/organocation transporter (APC superfamily) [Kurthia zopfii]GEK31905.1 putative amino acid permease YtnA [Kurthia zopfii]STX10612.1 Probable transport protein YifK [Kurthia zopfii]
MSKNQPELQRGLQSRHITLMSLGAAIGVGLFLGSAGAIKIAGPAVLLTYALGGIVIFFVMRALGEIAVEHPIAGSFSRYAQDYLGPLAGFITGWNYWFLWIVTCMAEITAVGIYMTLWFPDSPRWIWALAALVLMTLINLIAAKVFGEFEFWFAFIKVFAIIAMIVIGLGVILFGIGNAGEAVGFSNLWTNGGFMPHGISGVIQALPIVMFAYLGVEMIGVTAGEAKDPKKTLPKAINTVLLRVLVFYIGAITVILAIYPWDEMTEGQSPFVMMFDNVGIQYAAGIINFVVLTAALSSCNSGIFSTGRMIFNLAAQKQAPKIFYNVGKTGVPTLAILFSAAVLLIGVLLNYIIKDERIFLYITSVSTFGAVWTWVIILLVQIKYRKTLSKDEIGKLTFKNIFHPIGSYFSVAFLVMVVVLMFFNDGTRIALIVGPLWIAILVVLYYTVYKKQLKKN